MMTNRVSKMAKSLKKLGETQVCDWDFVTLLNTELKELEIARSLRSLGRIQVMEWDFRTVLPTVKKVANREVHLIRFLKRTASYKVMDWDFRGAASVVPTAASISRDKMQGIILHLINFLQYVAVNLIDEPSHAQIKVSEMGPTGLRFKLVLVKKDVSLLIGREGHTAAAIRNILKVSAGRHGVQVLLQILSHEEESAFLAKKGVSS